MTRITAIANHKGGVAKTTSIFQLACLLVRRGLKVLVIDLDPQAGITKVLGLNPKDLRYSVSDLFLRPDLPLKELIRTSVQKGIFVIPSTGALTDTEKQLVGKINRERILARRLQTLEGFDHILIDCPPALDMLNTNGIVASQEVIVPVESSYIAVRALPDFLRTLEEVRAEVNPNVKMRGIFLTKHKHNTNHGKAILASVYEDYASKMFNTVIPDSTAAKDSAALGKPVTDLQPQSPIAQGYISLLNELTQTHD